ncbi:response regulator transcription factor [Actinomadura sp. DC4]|uniref:response regulator transcription factor n=1 Tax=Actinomadura sp. DC4 TaxID=3055069 RepID=UPI0025AF23A9|nr:response regulator transcription factor [Actinomadura sp. DC4]MDN3351502.1 response regulator transcription factor [Actinomadura sp. DC4]
MSRTKTETRVLLVEDQRTLAEALTIALNAQPDLTCVGAARTTDEAVSLTAARCPDVVLMDIHLPGGDGIDGTRQIKALNPAVRVFILTADATPEQFACATEAGATGFLAKDGPFPEVLAAIRTRGRAMVAGGTFAVLTADLRQDACERAQSWACLTAREREVLALMGEGLGSQAIAEHLGMSRHTALGHVKRILAKLKVHSRREAVGVAVRTGLLPGPR